tara:strand:+ start:473 stop:880 length:408 start_codon:yes stop_codon:yes gene_type:complete
MRYNYFSFLLILLVFCSSNPYEEELSLNSEMLFSEISSFKDTDRDLNKQCELLDEEKAYHENDGLPLSYFVEYEYYKFRYLGASPENVEKYLNSLFNYCDMGEIFNNNWKSLDYQENLYQQLASAPIEPVGIIDE